MVIYRTKHTSLYRGNETDVGNRGPGRRAVSDDRISRNTPLLIQLFFLYYGLPKIGIKLNAFVIAVIGLTFLGASYMSEAFRGGLEAVNKIQEESGLSIGLTKPQLMRYIILPQALALFMLVVAYLIILLPISVIFSVLERKARYAGFGN